MSSCHHFFAVRPAINGGDPAAPGSGGFACDAVDQRNVKRPLGAHCDMGAFEAGGLLFLPLIQR